MKHTIIMNIYKKMNLNLALLAAEVLASEIGLPNVLNIRGFPNCPSGQKRGEKNKINSLELELTY